MAFGYCPITLDNKHLRREPARGLHGTQKAQRMGIRFISEDMQAGEIAVLGQDGENTVIIINAQEHDPAQRCAAVNRLLDRAAIPA